MDYANKQTDVALAELEKRIKDLYGDAARELQVTIDEYFDHFKKRDEEMRQLLEDGKVTDEHYRLWRMAQLGRGERYEALRDEIARRCNQANQTAVAYINDATPGIYSLNYNYSAYTIERVHGNVGFTLFDEQTVRRLIADDPDLLPAAGIDIPKDLRWNKQKMQRELVTGIMLGESTGQMADRFRRVTDMNRVSALRNARTAVTSAQNAGRQESFNRAAAMGIKLRKRWIATKDMRTRHSHGMMDGQTVAADECFVSELGSEMMYPGDKEHGALPCDIYNCRCTMRSVEKEGIEAEPRMMRVRNSETEEWEVVSEMTYSAWENWKKTGQKPLENSVKNGTIKVGSVLDNFDRKIRLTEPSEDLLKTNPSFATREYKWRNNCQRCVPTYEMRRRGFKVTAKPIPTKASEDYLARNYAAAWENQDRVWCMSGSGLQQIKAQMAAWGDGARAEVSVAWKDSDVGHVFVAEQRNGTTVFLDPQSGDTDCSRYFKNVKKGLTNILRIDNNTPSSAILDCCENGGE